VISLIREPTLTFSGVSKQYPTPKGPLTVLSEISLSLRLGEAAAIMGRSGFGMSTLLYIAGALEPPTRSPIGRHQSVRASRAGCRRPTQREAVFQDHFLLPNVRSSKTYLPNGDRDGTARNVKTSCCR
jgi:ABC-type lipoprotein export system ATPase subunit